MKLKRANSESGRWRSGMESRLLVLVFIWLLLDDNIIVLLVPHTLVRVQTLLLLVDGADDDDE